MVNIQRINDILKSNNYFRIAEEEFELDEQLLAKARDAICGVPKENEEQFNIPEEELAVFDDAFALTDEDLAIADEDLINEISAVELLDVNDIPEAVVVAEPSKPKYVQSPTFAQKMLRADEVLQDRYDDLKNYALRFKKLKSRISKKFDSINQGRLQFVKLSVAGKTLKLYLNMDITTTDPKFHCKDMSDKKTYVPVPVLLRVKSGRAVRYAKVLIDQCAESHGLVENKKFEEVDAIAMVNDFLYNQDGEKQ